MLIKNIFQAVTTFTCRRRNAWDLHQTSTVSFFVSKSAVGVEEDFVAVIASIQAWRLSAHFSIFLLSQFFASFSVSYHFIRVVV